MIRKLREESAGEHERGVPVLPHDRIEERLPEHHLHVVRRFLRRHVRVKAVPLDSGTHPPIVRDSR